MTIMQKVFWLIASLGNISSLSFYLQTQSLFSLVLLVLTLTYSLMICILALIA